MKKILLAMALFGITVILNPQTNSGFVYINTVDYNVLILVDQNTNTMRYYKGVPFAEEGLDKGFNIWLKDKIDKGFPFTGVIVPYRQSGQDPQMQEKRRTW